MHRVCPFSLINRGLSSHSILLEAELEAFFDDVAASAPDGGDAAAGLEAGIEAGIGISLKTVCERSGNNPKVVPNEFHDSLKHYAMVQSQSETIQKQSEIVLGVFSVPESPPKCLPIRFGICLGAFGDHFGPQTDQKSIPKGCKAT